MKLGGVRMKKEFDGVYIYNNNGDTMPLGRLVNEGRWVLGDSAWSRNSDSYCVTRFITSFAARDVETSNLLTSANTSPRYPLWLCGMPFFNTKKIP